MFFIFCNATTSISLVKVYFLKSQYHLFFLGWDSQPYLRVAWSVSQSLNSGKSELWLLITEYWPAGHLVQIRAWVCPRWGGGVHTFLPTQCQNTICTVSVARLSFHFTISCTSGMFMPGTGAWHLWSGVLGYSQVIMQHRLAGWLEFGLDGECCPRF